MLKLLCSVLVVTIDTGYTEITPSVQKVASKCLSYYVQYE